MRNRTVLIDSAFTKLEKRGVRAEGVPANAERVQAFLDVPTMRIGQARQDVSDRLAGEDPDKFRLLQSCPGKHLYRQQVHRGTCILFQAR